MPPNRNGQLTMLCRGATSATGGGNVVGEVLSASNSAMAKLYDVYSQDGIRFEGHCTRLHRSLARKVEVMLDIDLTATMVFPSPPFYVSIWLVSVLFSGHWSIWVV